ncbi:hypothetical protein [Microvirga sp. VF16]|uniref:hypothetical protein n=1 Tax=Microvirga sp. VF16 TaxID=2807101 RepID=UPI00193E1E6F|nr:hypothetical protein [Microvirga sp. VF16]QRM32592.1 hypothetical protein JO965_31395 [Microvirga sp. VF16]
MAPPSHHPEPLPVETRFFERGVPGDSQDVETGAIQPALECDRPHKTDFDLLSGRFSVFVIAAAPIPSLADNVGRVSHRYFSSLLDDGGSLSVSSAAERLVR